MKDEFFDPNAILFDFEEILNHPLEYFNFVKQLSFNSAPLFWLVITLAVLNSSCIAEDRNKKYSKFIQEDEEKDSILLPRARTPFIRQLSANQTTLYLTIAARGLMTILEIKGSLDKSERGIIARAGIKNILDATLSYIVQKDIMKSLLANEPSFLLCVAIEALDWIKLLIELSPPYLLQKVALPEIFFPWEQLADSCLTINLAIIAFTLLKNIVNSFRSSPKPEEVISTYEVKIFKPKPPYQISAKLEEFFQTFRILTKLTGNCYGYLETIESLPHDSKKTKQWRKVVSNHLQDAYTQLNTVRGQLMQKGNHFPEAELAFSRKTGIDVEAWRAIRKDWKMWVKVYEVSTPPSLSAPLDKLKICLDSLQEKETHLSREAKRSNNNKNKDLNSITFS